MKALSTLWDFIRPHTAIGTFFSITCLFLMAVYSEKSMPYNPMWYWNWVWLPALVAALFCNLFITGLNQYIDARLDAKNKPWLPIPSGRLTRKNALIISLSSLLLALGISAFHQRDLFYLIALISFVGAAYSLPPIKLKRHHVAAAAAIWLVRGILVNLGFFYVFTTMIHGRILWTFPIIALSIFMVFFGFAIAWFKDVPDMEGDRDFEIKTLAVTWGKERAFMAGVVAVALAYLSVIAFSVLEYLEPMWLFNLTHAGLLAFFLWKSRDIVVHDSVAIKRFYLMVWNLFFAEYFIFALGVYIS